MATNEDFRLDGIPVFVHPQGRGDSPLARVSITFRVGTYDEVLAYAGITRLAHQIICASIPLELREFISARNGGIFTMFLVGAPVEKFHDCLKALAAAIRQPDFTTTERLQRLLAADPNPDATYPADVMLRDRYGGVGPGTSVLQPMALTAVNESALATWIREHFCRENAAIVSTESAIASESFSLHHGQSRGVLLTEPQPLPVPGYSHNGDDTLGFQLLIPVSPAADLAIAVMAELIHKRVTQLEQLSPRVGFGSSLLDSSSRSFTSSMPVSSENAIACVTAIRQTLHDIAEGFVADEFVDRTKVNMQEALRDLIRTGEDALSRSQAAIFSSVHPADVSIVALDHLSKSDVCSVVKACLPSLLLYVPDGVEIDDLPLIAIAEPAPVTGKKFRRIGLPVYRASRTTVVANAEGLSCKTAGETTTVLYSNCTAVLDNGVSLQLIDRNGAYVKIFPVMYRKGGDLAKLIRANIDSTLVVPIAASDEDLFAQQQAAQHARDLSGWRAVVAGIAVIYLAALIFWASFRFTRFAGEDIYHFTGVAIAAGVVGWVLHPLGRRKRLANKLRASAQVLRHASPSLILTYFIDTLLILQAWDLLVRRDPPNYGGLLLLMMACIPFLFAAVTYLRSKQRGRDRYIETFRWMWIGNVAQLLVGFVAVFVASTLLG